MQPLDPGDPAAVGPYRLLARIAIGGTSVVYLGRSVGGRLAAVKVQHSGMPRERLEHEIAMTRAAAGGYSPALLGAEPDAAQPWLALQYIAGVSLREAVRLAGPLSPELVSALTVGIAEAVRAVHTAGILHLDINPANVLLTEDGPRLIDFGLAAYAHQAGTDVAGTPGFIAPERLTGGPAGPASDIYALGATLVYAATGSPPNGVPDNNIFRRCLDPEPARRPALAELLTPAGTPPLPPPITNAIHERIDPVPPPRLPAPAPPARRPRRGLRAGTIIAVLVGVAVAGFRYTADPSQPRARPAPSQFPSPSPSPSPSSAATSRLLTFYCTGNADVATLIYSVNGRSTMVDHPRLPWRKDIRVGTAPTAWQFRYSQPVGTLSCDMTMDGKHLYSLTHSGTAGPGGLPTAATNSYGHTN